MKEIHKLQKASVLKCPSSKKYQEIVETLKKAAATKGNEAHDIRKDAKAQVKRENAAAAETDRTLEEAEVQKIERRSMKCSSTVANQRVVPALIEHRRQDGWTSTSCVSDETAGEERLPEQRPHSIEKNKDEAGAQEIERRSTTSSSMNTRRRGVSALFEHRRQDVWTYTPCTCGRSGCSGGCDVLAGEERLPKQRPQGEEHPEHKTEVHLGAQFHIRMKRQVLSCSIPAATRAQERQQ